MRRRESRRTDGLENAHHVQFSLGGSIRIICHQEKCQIHTVIISNWLNCPLLLDFVMHSALLAEAGCCLFGSDVALRRAEQFIAYHEFANRRRAEKRGIKMGM